MAVETRVRLDNIGIIQDSEICLSGLTVITGLNNSGKTTIGKALFAVLSSMENLEEEAAQDKAAFGRGELRRALFGRKYRSLFTANRSLEECQTDILNLRSVAQIRDYIEALRKNISQGTSEEQKNQIKWLDGLQRKLSGNQEMDNYVNKKLELGLRGEFNNQILPVKKANVQGHIQIQTTDGGKIVIEIEENHLKNRTFAEHRSPYTNVIFIDNVFIMDSMENVFLNRGGLSIEDFAAENWSNAIVYKDHNQNLLEKLRKPVQSIYEEITREQEAGQIFEKINRVFPDEIIQSEGSYICSDSKLDIRNLATGSKLFAMIKILLEKGAITSETLLVFDEPESHLHPEWQNEFAEMIVMLIKVLKVHVLLTTHSPNFLMALEVYARKHEMWEQTQMYCTEKQQDGYMVRYVDIRDSMEIAYKKLADPLFELQKLKKKMEGADEWHPQES